MSVKGKPLWSGFFLFRLKNPLIFSKPHECFFVHCCQNKVPRDTSDPRSSPSCIFSSLPRIITIPERKSFPKIRADTSDPRSSLSWKFSALSRIIIFLERKSFPKIRADTSDPRSSPCAFLIPFRGLWSSPKERHPKDPCRYVRSAETSSLSCIFSSLPRTLH